MSAHCSSEDLERARKEGANGFISKQAGPLEWKAAIEAILSGGFWWLELPPAKSFSDVAPVHLSELELQVYRLLQQGLRTKEIAHQLGKNEHSIRHSRDQVRFKKKIWELEEKLRQGLP